ncbi:non-homologous end-joining DNA ligase [Streptomyces sp. MI02-2A]|uniref:non-homologous end-joining DNA ligase n=1 Tax=unclassified Streptomyces TaxID=2593676 RepID=UPI00099F3212|nr:MULTISPECIES: non-homologous end-joining DNA ligase [unclassified Streptomyces]MDX3265354.1 non-homologous end-joining DNA ligase [Streptomyces sp. MI02-2A]REE64857.1 DNA ligase D [Streptomyces sp. 3212.3]
MGNAVELEVAGRTVRLSSPDKVFFPERGFTKLDLAQYYMAVGPGILRALRNRPTTLERYPDGVSGESFFQKRAPKNMPDWIPTAHITFPSGRSADEMCPTEAAAVVWAAQYGTLTFHPWPVRRDDVDHPDELRIDLDPQPGTDFTDAVRAAHELRAVLDEFGGLRGWPKTSGGRGLHVFVPIEPRWTFTQVRRAAIAVGRELERRMPERVTIAWWKEERGERIFVDYNQTARDRTVASAYSVRPSPGAPVSAPLRWEEVDDVAPRDFDLETMPRRFAELGDVHADMDDHAYSLEALLELARRDEHDHGLGDLPYPPEYPKMPGEPKRVQPSRARREGKPVSTEGRGGPGKKPGKSDAPAGPGGSDGPGDAAPPEGSASP